MSYTHIFRVERNGIGPYQAADIYRQSLVSQYYCCQAQNGKIYYTAEHNHYTSHPSPMNDRIMRKNISNRVNELTSITRYRFGCADIPTLRKWFGKDEGLYLTLEEKGYIMLRCTLKSEDVFHGTNQSAYVYKRVTSSEKMSILDIL